MNRPDEPGHTVTRFEAGRCGGVLVAGSHGALVAAVARLRAAAEQRR
jgi:hypothetical protein